MVEVKLDVTDGVETSNNEWTNEQMSEYTNGQIEENDSLIRKSANSLSCPQHSLAWWHQVINVPSPPKHKRGEKPSITAAKRYVHRGTPTAKEISRIKRERGQS